MLLLNLQAMIMVDQVMKAMHTELHIMCVSLMCVTRSVRLVMNLRTQQTCTIFIHDFHQYTNKPPVYLPVRPVRHS